MKRVLPGLLLASLLVPFAALPGAGQDAKSAGAKTEGAKPFLLDVTNARAKSGRVPNGFGPLGLTRDQKERIYGIQEAYSTRLKELEEEMAGLKEEQSSQIENVLNDAQKAAVKKYNETTGSRRTAR